MVTGLDFELDYIKFEEKEIEIGVNLTARGLLTPELTTNATAV